jgi:hypothetical protein
MNIDDFFVIDDRQAKLKPRQVVLVSREMTYQHKTGKKNAIVTIREKSITMIGKIVISAANLPGLSQNLKVYFRASQMRN